VLFRSDFTRPFVMVRRRPGGRPSVFAAVLDPLAGESPEAVAEVNTLQVDDTAVMLRVTCGGCVYLVAACTDPARRVSCRSDEGAVVFRGRYGVMRRVPRPRASIARPSIGAARSVVCQLVGAAEMSWGGESFAGPGRMEGKVLAVAPGVIEIAAELAHPSRLRGLTAIITHGNGSTHGYQILRARRIAPGRVKLTVPATGFEYDEKKLTRFTSFPMRDIPGENRFAIDLMREEKRPPR
jgi:hypothetical protein